MKSRWKSVQFLKSFNILSTLRHVEKAAEKVAIENAFMFFVATVLFQMMMV